MDRLQDIEEIRERAQKLQASSGMQIYAGHAARDYITLLEHIEHLRRENEKQRQMLKDLVDGPSYSLDTFSWNDVWNYLYKDEAKEE